MLKELEINFGGLDSKRDRGLVWYEIPRDS